MAAIAWALIGALPGEAQITPGSITEEIPSRYDEGLRHAIYVPSNYTADRAHPLVLVMDARGAALVPLTRMVEAAERLGYVVISSYDTSSDDSIEPTARAVEAMIDDAQRLFNVDARRLYFVGFSGTARAAWVFARQLSDHTAGVIGFGAGLPSPTYLLTVAVNGPPQFAFYGGAGRLDFNYEELGELDLALDEHGFDHLIRFYEGGHGWPSEEVFTDAMEWMEVRAIRSGRSQRPERWIRELYTARLSRARALASRGDVIGAVDAYRSLIEGFDGLTSTDEARGELDRHRRSDAYRDARRTLSEQLEGRRAFDRLFGAFLDDARAASSPPDPDDAIERLKLKDLLRRADRADDPADADAAERMLSSVFVRTSYYAPNELIERHDFEGALAYLDIAAVIQPEHPRVCLGRARTYAQLGRRDEAMEALACALDAEAVTPALVRDDPLLEPLHSEGGFEALLAAHERSHP